MKALDFEKNSEKRWYVILPEWDGSKADLEMVMGADMMLDIYAQGEGSVSLLMSKEELREGFDTISLIEVCDSDTGGAYYQLTSINSIEYNFRIWLCDVTKFVFGDFPEKIYIQSCSI